ncbi:MAG: DNA topoisomerase III [Candidatus Pristimantibacillus lignocellulolyticus]|uniref:DNA topoisomerase n=1 Tax=Candidatus Pristimantibacillus lignocellulolyticus TaxID=2994561 RepID=A0A9J6ZF40_9BACL|nr:MAG: DNA topoisomerase III [Candidatus Pristimantibacillus lignocellulolyticus]
MKSLVLAEKPSVAKEIARVLGCTTKHKNYMEGPNYVVTWALGHLVELAEPEAYDKKYKTWELEDLPLLPAKMNIRVMKETSHQFKAIQALSKRNDLSQLVIATDAGREGELVARWIMELIHWKKPFTRLWISSQTDQAIKEGFRNLKPGSQYNDLYKSAVCRAEADWIIGLNMTRALTCKYNAQLAAGRVQTPTLSILMEREQEITGFQAKPYWLLQTAAAGFTATWRAGQGHDGKIWDKAEADQQLRAVKDAKTAQVSHIKVTEKQELHPLAYDLTELQRDANKKLGFSAKQTSNVLQKLYEQHKLVTYPRTDSRHLTSDMASTLKDRLERVAIGPYREVASALLRKPLQVTKRIVDDSKVSDHHAIIPTDQFVQLQNLSTDERKLYDLIVRRFIALFCAPYRYDETSVELTIGKHTFYAKGRVEKDKGWRAVYTVTKDGDEQEEDISLLPALQKGQQVQLKSSSLKDCMTTPPSRYTEASLLSIMEKHGLGTPATRADIIEKLLSTETIERRGHSLYPTQKGKQLIELVVDELKSPQLTSQWEQQLEAISRGKGDAKQFMKQIRAQAEQWVNKVKTESKQYKPHNMTGSKCPDCSEPLLEVKGKQGKRYVCSNRECSYKRHAEPLKINKRCPQCRKKMELHDGKAGKYAQCRPCNVIEKLDDKASGKMNKQETQRLMKQYNQEQPSIGNSLADKLKAALEQQK